MTLLQMLQSPLKVHKVFEASSDDLNLSPMLRGPSVVAVAVKLV